MLISYLQDDYIFKSMAKNVSQHAIRKFINSESVAMDSNAYFWDGTDQGVWQDTYGELFGIIKNGNGETFFIWWFDLIVQEFVLEKDTLLLLDRRGRSETYIRVK